jgi:[ribosomal protein S18]-alanine N-acetyltransferase
MDLIFSLMTREDLPEVMDLEQEAFSWPWTEEMFVDELEREFSYILLARQEDGQLAGFINFWVLFDEAHINNVAVKKSLQKQGIGRYLVTEALGFAYEEGARSATLEVRRQNFAAVKLYENLGFELTGIRKGYYEDPPDDALIMWLYEIGGLLKKVHKKP